MTEIIDNEGKKLSDALVREFKDASEVAIASAFFDVRGFGALEEGLRGKPLRFLIGHEPKEESKWKEEALRELERSVLEDLSSNEDELGYFGLIQRAMEYFSDPKREVRLYCRGNFHSKAYLAASPSLSNVRSGVAVVGSSNFTYGGLVSNRELNMLNTDREAVSELASWFEKQWAEPNSRDFKKEFIELLSNYVTTRSAYEVVAKALYETYKGELEQDPDTSSLRKVLMPHQLLSYKQCIEKLEKYGGVVLADSTGLGKTLVMYMLGVNALKQGRNVLLIAPKSVLETTWMEEFEKRQMFKNINTEMISAEPEILEEPQYKGRDFVIVDEAHWFRNPFSKRYSALRNYLVKNGAQVVLGTATPVNNSLLDLYYLFALYAKEDCVSDITGQSLRRVFEVNQKRWLNREPIRDLEPVLERLMVRHSRRGAQALSKDDPRLKFPERVLDTDPNSRYPAGVDYARVEEVFSSMNLSFYDLTIDKLGSELRTPEGEPLQRLVEAQKKEQLKELIKAIVQLNLFKRLESGYAAYRATLKSLDEYLERAVSYAQSKGVFVPPRMRAEPLFNLDEELPEPEQLFSKPKYSGYLEKCRLTEEEVRLFVESCLSDRVKIRELFALIPSDDSADPKFRAFERRLRSILSSMEIGSRNGVIVFTQYRDTALFLYSQVRAMGLGVPVRLVTGEESRDEDGRNREEAVIINRFRESGGVLVSTDVMSEGQNLQNAQYVINYDFPWNPVVVIQRVGRVDRLGSPYDKVYLTNMMPLNSDASDPRSLEHFLGVIRKLLTKLVAIRETIGLDASTLGEEAEPRDFGLQEALAKGDMSVLTRVQRELEEFVTDPIDALAKIFEDKGLDWLRGLPDGIGAYKKGEREALFVLFKDEAGRTYWRLRFFDGKHETLTSVSEIVKILFTGETDRKGERVDYENLIQRLVQVKQELLDDLTKAARKMDTIRGAPVEVTRDVRDVYNALAKLGSRGEKLAAIFRKRANDRALVQMLKDAWKKGKLLEEAERTLFSQTEEDQKYPFTRPLDYVLKPSEQSNPKPPKVWRVCWCWIKA